MKLSQLRERYDDYDPGDDNPPNPKLELHLADPPDSEDPTEMVVVKVEADNIYSEPDEYEGGHLSHRGTIEVESFDVKRFKFKGEQHELSDHFPGELVKYLNEFEHEDLEHFIHGAREGMFSNRQLTDRINEWITNQLNEQLLLALEKPRHRRY